MPLTNRIDVHHHYFPKSLDFGGSTQHEWPVHEELTKWSPEVSITAMDKLGIQKAILSLPNPVPNTRQINMEAHEIVRANPDRFGFFASLPMSSDMSAILEELRFALDELHADGVAITSSYGIGKDARYVAHQDFAPLWQALHDRKTIVFLHGDQTPSGNAAPGKVLPIPIVEVPNETYKAAADLVTSGFKKRYCDAKIILSHAGGSTPFLAARVAVLSNYVGTQKFGESLSVDEILQGFKSFYYETALSGYEVNLVALEKFVGRDHILFGTDFPAVTTEMAAWYTKNVDEYFGGDAEFLKAINSGNWEKLIK